MGEDYDEDLMTAFAAQNGGRARYISSPDVLPGAFRDELSRAAASVARNVRVHIEGAGGATVERVLGYDNDAGWVRLPDFAAGEERRVLVKLRVPSNRGLVSLASVDLRFDDAASGTATSAQTLAQATFTSDAAQLATAPGAAAVEGAKAEMADLALQAARFREEGRRDEAAQRLSTLDLVAKKAAREAPAAAPAMLRSAAEYQNGVAAIAGAGDGASKSLKEKTFDAVRAPVKGW
jgi:hypothetical protein